MLVRTLEHRWDAAASATPSPRRVRTHTTPPEVAPASANLRTNQNVGSPPNGNPGVARQRRRWGGHSHRGRQIVLARKCSKGLTGGVQ